MPTDDLGDLMRQFDGRLAVAVFICPAGFQFITYGRAGPDKAEAVRLREFLARQMGADPNSRTSVQEDYVRDAGTVKEQRDRLLLAVRAALDLASRVPTGSHWPADADAVLDAIRAARDFAQGAAGPPPRTPTEHEVKLLAQAAIAFGHKDPDGPYRAARTAAEVERLARHFMAGDFGHRG